jgi:RNase P subunit RPR2
MKNDWRCKRCRKLLGVIEDERIHIQFSRGHQYIVAAPATSVCRKCQTLNELPAQRPTEGVKPAETN